MNVVEIAEKYKIEYQGFVSWLQINKLKYKDTWLGIVVDDNLVASYVEMFKKDMHFSDEDLKIKAQMEAQEKAKQVIEDAEKKKAMSEMLITSGFNFDGYRIVKYSGYISGDDAIQVDRGMAVFGIGRNTADDLMKSLVTIRRNALRELKEAAYDLGCNAVIGVDFDYLTLDPHTANLTGGTTYQPYVFGVTANGNAVIIEKIQE